ncbi:epoxide hydrolase family protein [Sinimarinibacterium flocculans]|uniref:epoxide hydrolase family protein n=1 Tax=Sinimarinibacterium flocculans TaxID=985250 RepID=UPI002492CCC6|nr:epoxide hydrolase family protein [Sinimarinibacterium flocculans]
MTSIQEFRVDVPESVLTDLKERLARARIADDFGNDAWQYGTNGAYLRELVAYWKDGYDWRRQEREINRLPQFRTEIEGIPIHFVHVRGKGPRPMPLILSHGWPWTFWDFHKLIGPLTDPAAHGGDPADAFDVVVPSLPGYGFSTPLRSTGINFWRTADLWVQLMARLGYERFSAYGADWGALITSQLGHKYADRLHGIHTNLPLPLDLFFCPLPEASEFAGDEQGWAERNAHFFGAESGYSAIQATKPQSLAYGLNDSPIAQCAWILEKRRTWSDCGGDVESVFSKDDLLTTVMIYWVTQSGGTAARYYYECAHNPWQPSHDRTPRVEAPSGVAIFENEVLHWPRQWIEKNYDLRRYRRFAKGGHFAPAEQPELLTGELREFFRTVR